MHKAYFVSAIFNQNLIESIAAYENNIIIGTEIGQLYMYSMRNQDGIIVRKTEKYLETADKKPICQLKVIPEENLLFALTNGVINVYNFGGLNFSLIHRCLETKGCNIFEVDVKAKRSSTGRTFLTITLCVGIKRSLRFFLWSSDQLESLPKEIQLKDIPRTISWKENVICIGFKDQYVIYDTFSTITENNEAFKTSSLNSIDPCVSLIRNSIFGITEDDYVVFIDSNIFTEENQNLCENIPKPIKWSSSVFDFVWDEPYVIGRTANGIEVRVLGWSPYASTFIQNIPQVNAIRLLARSGSGEIFAASRSQVWYIRMVDIAKQIKDLLPQKRFKLAIELNNMSKEPETCKMEANRDIRLSYAKDLFENKKFLSAMDEFQNAEASPYEVISLFPDSIKGEFKITEAAKSQENMLVFKDKELDDAISALIDYLFVARKKAFKESNNIEKLSESSLLSFIDTTLLKCYIETNKDSLIVPLLRCKQCNFSESERTLKKYQKYSELFIHYQINEEHEKVLELLQEQARIENTSFYGPDRTVKYLQNFGNDKKLLVFKFSEWVLHTHPEAGLKIFTNASTKLKNNTIPTEEVLDFLSKTSDKKTVLAYLEHVVYTWNDVTAKFHNTLIMAYVGQIKELRLCSSLSEKKLEHLKSYRLKLNAFLRKSDKYSPETVLQTFPSDYLFDERIIVLRKMKQHQMVFVIYIQIQRSIEKAFRYCERNYAENQNIFEILLETLLNPLKSSPYRDVEFQKEPNIDFVLLLLRKYGSKINPAWISVVLPVNIKDLIKQRKNSISGEAIILDSA